MRSATVTNLRRVSSWEPTELLPRPEVVIGPPSDDVLGLADIVSVIPAVPIRGGAELAVTSAHVDKGTGVVVGGREKMPYRGFQFESESSGNERDGLHEGDVLVPLASDVPAVLIRAEMGRELVFTQAFVAVRPVDLEPLLLWALLTCRTGMKARQEAVEHTWGSGLSRIPWEVVSVSRETLELSEDRRRRLRRLLPQTPVQLESEAPPVSAWAERDLGEFPSWEHAIRDITTTEPHDGIPLADIAEIRLGRPKPKRSPAQLEPRAEQDDRVSMLAEDVVLKPGDVVLNRFGNRPESEWNEVVRAAKPSEVRIRLREPSLAPRVAAYLASDAGRARLRARSFGSALRAIPIAELKTLLIPHDILDEPVEDYQTPRVLSARLEEALWT